ncbi:hypothetical protein [Streptomyces himalayensis]|uniref:Uncharacterized protein n=1 Tax=Streptomyces himalayensis subsp. himalayensis TaxID=2756131 RepID=A0A7W0ID40_9ACTN|nr:hypothetical protein [Streptomyces himalayensis]MBA2951288.1 hypothetical protein [Streptomyces himalayensis subsp. himalayensis]
MGLRARHFPRLGAQQQEREPLRTAASQHEASVLHLLECRGCRAQQTLPRRFHPGVVVAHLEQTERHGPCRREPYARELEYVHGVYRFELDCGWHTTGRWLKDVTVAEVAVLVQAFVDAALAAQEGPLSPDAETEARTA